MKNKNYINLILSLLILAAAFSIISVIASPSEVRFTLQGINPWNTVKGVYYMFDRYIQVNRWINYTLTVLLVAYIWWRIHALVSRFRKD